MDERALMHSVAITLKRKGERAAFNAWQDMRIEQKHEKRILMRSINSMRYNGLIAGYRSWVDYVVAAMEAQTRIYVALNGFSGHGMRQAWSTWSEASAQGLLMAQRMRRVVQRDCAMAVLQWRATAREAKKSEARLRSVLSSLSPEGRATRAAWKAWSCLLYTSPSPRD